MSVFKRAEWKSGLTYRQTCSKCKTIITYTDDILDFRPWYADGFIYCPNCHEVLRHAEGYAINSPSMNYTTPSADDVAVSANNASLPAFCTQCGKKFDEADRFCSQCGAKR